MTLRKSVIATLISTALALPAFAQDEFSKRLYVGFGGGTSTLTPESQIDGVFVDDDSDAGGKLFIGWDFARRFAVELARGDLGEAAIGPNNLGSISYEVTELSGVYHFYNLGGYESLVGRRGLGLFAKLGLGFMDNDSNLQFERENDVHLAGGLGLEYATRFGLALRGEFEAFDEDATLASLSLLWRFGGGGGSDSDDGIFSSGGVIGDTVGGLIGGDNDGDAPTLDDDDGDGVPNSLDDCLDSAPGEPVTATGCALFGGVLAGVQFESGSDRLVDDAQVVLNDAADALLQNPSLKVEVQAHTDSQGAADYNVELSKQRALATVRYLMLRGVPSEQMTARAFGEAKPIADNSTEEGRFTNRRVEFHVIER